MDQTPLDERSFAFVVKLWQERREIPGAAPAWRGSVEDVQSGSRVYFGTLGELCDILTQRSGMVLSPRLRDRLRWTIRHR